jgi:hypothetical protein
MGTHLKRHTSIVYPMSLNILSISRRPPRATLVLITDFYFTPKGRF